MHTLWGHGGLVPGVCVNINLLVQALRRMESKDRLDRGGSFSSAILSSQIVQGTFFKMLVIG